MGILYRLSFPDGKCYIGITTESLTRRVQRHVNYARANKPYALSSAIRKHGESSFKSEALAYADDWSDLLRLEVAAIKQYDSRCPNGYNMTGGGHGSLGMAPSPEKRGKISASLSGRKLTDAHRKAVSDAQKGKSIPLETRVRMSSAHKSRPPMSLEQRAIRSEAAIKQHAARRKLPGI